MANLNRITTREFYSALMETRDKIGDLVKEQDRISSRVIELHHWAFADNGDKGIDTRLGILEKRHLQEDSRRKVWMALASICISLSSTALGYFLGAIFK